MFWQRAFKKLAALHASGRQSHAKIACDWRPVAFKLYPSGRQSHTNYMRLQSRQFFASTLRGQLFEQKMKTPLKKSKNLRDT
jgi:hypothetical protein